MAQKQQEQTASEQLVEAVVLGLQERKGINIAILDMRELENSICKYFVICEGESTTHVSAVADSVEEFAWKKVQDKPFHAEGHQSAQWVLIDFVDVVVHVFHKSVRHYYGLEELWADAPRTEIENLF